MNEDGQSVSYVYGFTQADVAGGTSAVMTQTGGSASVLCGGIDESHPPLFWQSGEVAAIVSQVSRSEFCGPAGEANLQDLVWLAARAASAAATDADSLRNSISAHMCLMAWKLPMARPNWMRILA